MLTQAHEIPTKVTYMTSHAFKCTPCMLAMEICTPLVAKCTPKTYGCILGARNARPGLEYACPNHVNDPLPIKMPAWFSKMLA